MQRTPSPPAVFVGREADLERLQKMLRRVTSAVIFGVAGVGKSALALAAAARWDGPVVYSKITQNEPVASLVDHVRRQLAGGPVPEAPGEAERVLDLAERLDGAGACWVLDDVHHLDAGGREALLTELVGMLRGGRLVATSRELWARASDAPDRVEIRLGGLDEAGARALWASLNELYGPSSGFERALQRAHGNPFLLRRAHAGGLEGEDPIAAALRALDPDERVVAGALAVADTPLPPGTVGALLPDGRARAALRRLVSRLIADVDGAGSSAVHDLFRDAMRAELGADERRARVAELARLLPEAELDPVVRAREVTRHLCELGQYDEASRWLVGRYGELIRQGAAGDLARCIEAVPREHRTAELTFVRARAFGRLLDPRRAHDELERLVAAGAEPRATLRLAFAQTAALLGRMEAAERTLRELLDEGGAAAPVLAQTTFALVRTYRGHGEEARALLDAAEARAEAPLDRGTICFCRAFSLWIDGLEAEAERALRPAIEYVGEMQAAVLRGLVFAPGIYAHLLARAGRFDEAEAYAQRAESVRGARDDLLSKIYLKSMRGSLALERGDRIAAAAALSEARDTFERAGHALGVYWSSVTLARALFQLGKRRRAHALLDAVAREAEQQGVLGAAQGAERARREDPLTRLREPPAGDDGGADALDRARGGDAKEALLEALRAAAAGRGERARALLASAAGAARAPGYAVERALDHLARAVLARVEGRAAEAAEEMRRAIDEAEREGVDPDLVPAIDEALGRTRVVTGTAGRVAPEAPEDLGRYAVVVDARRHELRGGGRVVALKSRPMLRQLLYALAGRPGRVVSKDDLARALWSRDYNPLVHDNALKANVTHLRRLIEKTELAIEFEGSGYRLQVPERFVFIQSEPEA